MGTFSVSMPEELTRKLDAVADREHRSRSAQVILILEEWFALNYSALKEREKK